MRIGGRGRLLHLVEQRRKRSVCVHPVAQHQGVDVEADLRFEIGVFSAGYWRAQQDLLLAGIPVQQGFHQGDQRHEQGRAVLPTQGAQVIRLFRSQMETEGIPLEGLHRGAGEVGGQIEHRDLTGQLLVPVVAVRFDLLVFQTLVLPGGVVFVLNAERGQGALFTAVERFIQKTELLGEHAHRPAVRDDVVQVEREDVLLFFQLQEHYSDKRPIGQIKRFDRISGDKLQGLFYGLRCGGQIEKRD